jgi:Lar family restriction alleviation protein
MSQDTHRELLPCPFCGARAWPHIGTNGLFRIQCLTCEATSGERHLTEEAEAAWNRRAALATQPPAVQGEPDYWQWRRKGEPWTLEKTFNSRVYATTGNSEVRPLYASTPSREVEPLTDEQIRGMCKHGWVFETVKQWVRIVEACHGIHSRGEGEKHDGS